MLTLSNLKSPKGAHKNIKRIGRGQGSGQGTQAGKGHKGQKARSGGRVAAGFEGGQMPLYRRLPKKGFKNALFRKDYANVSLKQIADKFDGEVVTKEAIIQKGLIKGAKRNLPVKILASEGFSKALEFQGIDKFSATAKELVEKANGKIQ